MEEKIKEIGCHLKAKVSIEEARERLARAIVPLETGITLTKFTGTIGYKGGDVRSLRKTLTANNIATVEYGGKNYIRSADAGKLLQVVYGLEAKKSIKKTR